jgi:AhpC/TSA antioxidant enzyme
MRSRVRCPLAVSRQLSVGDAFPVQILGRLETLSGEVARVPDPGFLVHVQMRRFAGCPVCNLHLRSVITRIGEVTGAGVREVVVFHSTIQELRQYESDLPFTVLADPRKDLYRALGVESSLLTVLSPRFWPRVPAVMAQLARHGPPLRPRRPMAPAGGQLGLPADFLVDPRGQVVAFKYGQHASDQWSVSQLLAHAALSVDLSARTLQADRVQDPGCERDRTARGRA